MEEAYKLVNELDHLLSSSDFEKAFEFIEKAEFEQCFDGSCSELVSVICSRLNDANLAENKKLFDCCESLINIVADKIPPDEGVLHIIDEIEQLSDAKLISLLVPMQKTVLRIKSKLGLSIDWCFNSIHRHLDSLPCPEEEDLEGDEKKILDAHPCVRRIVDMYTHVLPFYEPFINKLVSKDPDLDEKNTINLKDAVLSSCFRLLGKPLVFIDLEYDGKAKSTARCVSESIIEMICKVVNSDLISVLHVRSMNNVLVDVERTREELRRDLPPKDTFPVEYKYSSITLGVYCYLIFGEGIKLNSIPQIYSPLFICNKTLYLSIMMLRGPSSIHRKGLLLVKGSLDRFVEFAIPESELESVVYRHLIDGLYSVAIYSYQKENRQLSVLLIKDLLMKFNSAGRYLILVKMVKLSNHSGILGYLAMLFKDILIDVLDKPPSESEQFTEKRVTYLLDCFCRLPHKAQSDLIELSDQIISCLNLIRFIVIRDSENRTGIKEYVKILKKGFFKYLLDGVNLSRAHYKLKLEDVEVERKKRKPLNHTTNTTITIGKEKIPNLPVDEKLFFINSALNGFDVIESLLCRLNECIDLYST